MGTWILPPELAALLASWATCLDARSAARLPVLFVGVFFATGRRTASSWFRAAGVGTQFRSYYYLLGTIGRKAEWLASGLLRLVLRRLHRNDDYWLFALDDTPTPRW